MRRSLTRLVSRARYILNMSVRRGEHWLPTLIPTFLVRRRSGLPQLHVWFVVELRVATAPDMFIVTIFDENAAAVCNRREDSLLYWAAAIIYV